MNSTGVLMVVLGVMLIARSIFKDSQEQTLPERLLGNNGTASASTSGSSGGTAAATGSSVRLSKTISYQAGGSTPSTLPYGTPLEGSNATSWAQSILKTMGAPTTSANVSSILDWFHHEGGGGQNNPMNTTLDTAGATGSINSDGVKNYATPADGVRATVATLQNGYSAIVSALKTGGGLANSSNPEVASELSKWSGGGYSSL